MAEDTNNTEPEVKAPVEETDNKVITEDAPADKTKKIKLPSHFHRFKAWYVTNKKISIPASILAFLVLLAIIPWTRYTIAGVVVKKDVGILVTDSKSGSNVSKATVTLAGKSAETNGQGYAMFHHVSAGSHKVTVTKKYYLDASRGITVGFSKNAFQVKAVATGREIKVGVKDLVSLKPLGGVEIKVADVSAKTDPTGVATIVLPVGTKTEKAHLALGGYNDADVTVKVSDNSVADNEFSLTPAGKIYFLSKLSGKIDVVKTNLDGSARQTVIAGTGNEDQQNTVLLASRDWKYLALLSRRAGSNATLYLINTGDDTMSTIDEGNAIFTLAGWSDHNFVYTVYRNTVQQWQPHQQALKSFNADSKQLLTLDQTGGQGTDAYNYVSEGYGDIHIIGKTVMYSKNWTYAYSFLYPNAPTINDKSAGIYSINSDGSNPQKLKTFSYNVNNSGPNGNYGVYIYLSSIQASPSSVYYQESLQNGSQSSSKFFEYSNNKLSEDASVEKEITNLQNNGYPTYLLSPSGNQSFWTEPRDGKNTLFVGDQDGANGKQIASLSDYLQYGWYSDNYLLVSKNGSELYIMGKDGKAPVVKISDYHKPDYRYNGYGGGYGGI